MAGDRTPSARPAHTSGKARGSRPAGERRRADRGPSFGDPWLDMQRGAGNRAVNRIIEGRAGGLTLGPVGDRFEREADHISRMVGARLRRGAPPSDGAPRPSHGGVGTVQRAPAPTPATGGAAPGGRGLSRAVASARSGGRGLDASVKAPMESAFGHAFDDVRLHTGPRADRLTRAVSARAFTTGRDIFFRRGEYQPKTERGRGLLAHELTHVLQQRGNPEGYVQRKVGFEFQTVGAHAPSVIRSMELHGTFDYDSHMAPAQEKFEKSIGERTKDEDFEQRDKFGRERLYQTSAMAAYYWRDHGKKLPLPDLPDGASFEVDKGDLEIVTDAFDETPEGHKALLQTIAEVIAYLGKLHASRQEAHIELYREKDGVPVSKGAKRRQVTFVEDREEVEMGEWHAIMWPDRLKNPLDIRAAMQATMGITFEALGALVDAQIDSVDAPIRSSGPTFDKSIYLGYKSLLHEGKEAEVKKVRTNVDAWLKLNVKDVTEHAILRGLLLMLGLRFAHGSLIRKLTKAGTENKGLLMSYAKDYAIMMNRTALSEIHQKLASIGRLDGYEAAAKAPEAVFGEGYGREDCFLPTKPMTIGGYFDVIGNGRSEAGFVRDAAMGIISSEDKGSYEEYHMESAVDVGTGYDGEKSREGMLIELRQLGKKGGVPASKWIRSVDAAFRAQVFLNSGKKTRLAPTKMATPEVERSGGFTPFRAPKFKAIVPRSGITPAPIPGITPAPIPGITPAPIPGITPAPIPGQSGSGTTKAPLAPWRGTSTGKAPMAPQRDKIESPDTSVTTTRTDDRSPPDDHMGGTSKSSSTSKITPPDVVVRERMPHFLRSGRPQWFTTLPEITPIVSSTPVSSETTRRTTPRISLGVPGPRRSPEADVRAMRRTLLAAERRLVGAPPTDDSTYGQWMTSWEAEVAGAAQTVFRQATDAGRLAIARAWRQGVFGHFRLDRLLDLG